MNKQFKIYGSYLGILAVILIAIALGLPTKAGLWAALGVAAIYAIFWPRWGR